MIRVYELTTTLVWIEHSPTVSMGELRCSSYSCSPIAQRVGVPLGNGSEFGAWSEQE